MSHRLVDIVVADDNAALLNVPSETLFRMKAKETIYVTPLLRS